MLKQLEEDTNLITGRMRARNIFFFLFLVGVLLCSPGFFLALCSNNYSFSLCVLIRIKLYHNFIINIIRTIFSFLVLFLVGTLLSSPGVFFAHLLCFMIINVKMIVTYVLTISNDKIDIESLL